MKKEEAKYFIGLCFGNFTLYVMNARSVYGHDDSLAYNAEFEVHKGGKKLLTGIAWNDGWGGCSSFSANAYNQDIERIVIDEINKYADEHLNYKWNNYTFTLHFIGIIDRLVELSLDGKGANCNKLFNERALLNYLQKK